MQRLIIEQLLQWKRSHYRKPLIVQGVRQVGKTWVLREFGARYYRHVAYFNFEENEDYQQFFTLSKDPHRILQNLSIASNQAIDAQNTLIIFDEIQDCPALITSLKYFCENAPEYHVVCAARDCAHHASVSAVLDAVLDVFYCSGEVRGSFSQRDWLQFSLRLSNCAVHEVDSKVCEFQVEANALVKLLRRARLALHKRGLAL